MKDTDAFGTTRIGRVVLAALFIIMIAMMMPMFIRVVTGGS
ncbi:hypothetical protein [Candidatus Palauibacter sp.]